MASTAKEPVFKGQQTTMIVVSVVMTFFGALALILRIIGRLKLIRKLGTDDWLMVAGMIFTGGYLFEILYGLRFGIGLHTKDDSLDDMVELLKLIYAIQLTYNTTIAIVKLSIVFFYLRLATVNSRLRKASYGTIIFICLFWASSQTATILQCLPLNSNWDLSGTIKKTCINTEVYFYCIAVINILLDIWILALPVSTLKDIKRPRRDKIVLFIIFGIGGFSCISSIIRLYTIKVFTASQDQFYDGVPINIWSMIEINVAVICASIPAMKPLFTKTIRDRLTNSSKSRSHFNTHHGHQMMPLSGNDDNKVTRSGRKNGYSVNATSNGGMGGSEEHIVPRSDGITYEREFTVEEQYIDSSKVLENLKQAEKA